MPLPYPPFDKSFCWCLFHSGDNSPVSHYICQYWRFEINIGDPGIKPQPSKDYSSHIKWTVTCPPVKLQPKLTSYSETCQSPKDNAPNGHQISANLGSSKIQTYTEVVSCLKEVKTKPTVNSANDHQQLAVFRLEWVVQLNYSGDIVNSGGGTKHCHFYSPEQAQSGSVTLKTLSQDPCPASALSANLNPVKIEEAKTHDIKAQWYDDDHIVIFDNKVL
ncbi:hypothetical protein DSO57_1013532 [Entomophthora muscae]|uniref:Uncharacterized protein n=1 Tax=Entomophthora muscae TaxID=34485 RepID=A0ACC2UR14_9FUNG|nr:hypothetical protein DSO57_1013532 [Entomophthora muscae]